MRGVVPAQPLDRAAGAGARGVSGGVGDALIGVVELEAQLQPVDRALQLRVCEGRINFLCASG